PVVADVAHAGARDRLVADDVARRSGDENLAAVRGCRDPCDEVHVEPDVALGPELGLAGVDAHPDAERGLAGPVLGAERLLRLGGRGDGIRGAGERDEERVALRVDLATVIPRVRGAYELAMTGERCGVLAAELPERPGRALDIRREEGDRSPRQISRGGFRHGPSVRRGG